MTTTFLTTTSATIQTTTLPADWSDIGATIEGIGAGGNGSARQSSTIGGTGGGAGAYAKKTTPGLAGSQVVYYLLSAGGSAIDSWCNDLNLVLNSQTFDNGASWGLTGATITANATTAPDGSSTADDLVEDATTAAHNDASFPAIVAIANTSFTFSCYVKPSLRTECALYVYNTDFSQDFFATFTLSGGGSVLSSGVSGANAVFSSASITSEANGFYRCRITGIPDTTSTSVNVAIFGSLSGSDAYAGSNGSTALSLWGAQGNYGTVLKPYTATTTIPLYSVLCKAGTNGTTSAAGVHQTGSQGDVVFEGGNGFKPGAGVAIGGGGGGAGGPSGAGSNSTTSAGGAADNGTVAGGAQGANGNAGTEFQVSPARGSGSGAGGRSGVGVGFIGGSYGGGGSGSGTTSGNAGGAGAQAFFVLMPRTFISVIQETPPAFRANRMLGY